MCNGTQHVLGRNRNPWRWLRLASPWPKVGVWGWQRALGLGWGRRTSIYYWNSLPRVVVDSPLLAILKSRLDMFLKDILELQQKKLGYTDQTRWSQWSFLASESKDLMHCWHPSFPCLCGSLLVRWSESSTSKFGKAGTLKLQVLGCSLAVCSELPAMSLKLSFGGGDKWGPLRIWPHLWEWY